jgi:hypothetical protein
VDSGLSRLAITKSQAPKTSSSRELFLMGLYIGNPGTVSPKKPTLTDLDVGSRNFNLIDLLRGVIDFWNFLIYWKILLGKTLTVMKFGYEHNFYSNSHTKLQHRALSVFGKSEQMFFVYFAFKNIVAILCNPNKFFKYKRPYANLFCITPLWQHTWTIIV